MKKENMTLLLLTPLLFTMASCGNSPADKKIIVGASPTPHALILNAAKPLIEKEGYELEVRVMNDYVTPNLSLDSGDLDANYFQHEPYLNDFNKSHNTNLVCLFKVHFEPMGIYSLKHKTLESGGKIAIPNDTSNEERARALLIANGLTGTISTLEAQTLPQILNDVDYAVINGNYALSAGITDKCITTEDSQSEIATNMANLIATKAEWKDYEFTKILKKALLSDTVKNYINTTFGSAVKVVF